MSAGEISRGFSLNHKCFPANHGLVDQQYKCTETLYKSFSTNSYFHANMKFFPTNVFLYMV